MVGSQNMESFTEDIVDAKTNEQTELGGSVSNDSEQIQPSSLDSPFCKSFFSAIDELELETQVMIFPAGTDARYLRAGIPVLNFSPMNNTPVLPHDHDEYLNVDTFLRGIDIYQIILQKIST
ncbi:aminoacylase-1-like [Octopus sinensis]|uniref:Aminoacylase-1-like n=1 Tax=Octopus sinensis TaxID=2607531 RepID=A0A6P7U158_9MOLL|nr:aminoacylase-1-like [Octopus sinensis]